MKKYVATLTIGLAMAMLLTGCGVAQVNLTESEEQQIVSYASDLLIKYDKNHMSNLVDTSHQRELDARVEALKAQKAQMAEESRDNQDIESDSDANDGQDSSGGSALNYPAEGEQDVAKALGNDDFSVSYEGYELCQSYPYDGSEGDYFAMDATAGRQLMVFHFAVHNDTLDDKHCDFLTKDPIIRIIVNDNERLNALTTLLQNDLATVDETIAAGDVYDAVVVLETDPGYESQIDSMSLLIKVGDTQNVIPLGGGE